MFTSLDDDAAPLIAQLLMPVIITALTRTSHGMRSLRKCCSGSSPSNLGRPLSRELRGLEKPT